MSHNALRTLAVPPLRPRRGSWALSLAAGALAALAAVPAAGDWIITREGARLETRGAWTVAGRLVSFTGIDGRLYSLRASEVDLEASADATAEAARLAAAPPRPAAKPAKKPVLVITDADVGHVEEPKPGAPAEEPEAAAGGQRLVVTSWEREEDPTFDGVVLIGELENRSPQVAGNARLTVRAFDEAGISVASADARLSASTLRPGDRASFRVELPGLLSFAAVRFEPGMVALETAPQSPPEGESPPEA